mmetsp:Transcript_18603/g.53792  ORF Transcript_18603/g.53792 Transcript_18603/m.53792 type:complete len:261 (-) Transcript_18603:150-932(-)
MRATAAGVDAGLGHPAPLLCAPDQVEDLGARLDRNFGQAHADHAPAAADVLQVQPGRILRVRKEVAKLLIVDFQILATDSPICVRSRGQAVDHRGGGARDQATARVVVQVALHGVGFPRPGLAVGETRRLVACQHFVHQRVQRLGENLVLRAEGGQHSVEVKRRAHLFRAARDHLGHQDLSPFRRGCHCWSRAGLLLPVAHGPQAADYADIATCGGCRRQVHRRRLPFAPRTAAAACAGALVDNTDAAACDVGDSARSAE